ncbi:MAG: hypothetical protein IKF96_04645 [Eggerthellaceae bacterium]|nr:hypothetical protein [Eggerthellaceae bacterium]
MPIVLSHASAFRFWRRFAGDTRMLRRVRRPKAMEEPLNLTPSLAEELAVLGFTFPEDERLHLLFATPALRSRVAHVASHVFADALPEGSLVRLSERVLVASPELAFAQMAESFTFERETMAGMELCGTYAIMPDNSLRERAPLANAEGLASFAASLMGPRSKAVRATRYVLDGAASPMEAKLALLLCLPTTRGGYGLPLPELNARIDLGEDSRKLYDAAFCRADLFWREAGLDVEYDGRASHDGDAHTVDVAREQALEARGISVTRLTFAQIESPEAFDVVAKTLGRRLGKGTRVRSRDFEENRLFLRGELEL